MRIKKAKYIILLFWVMMFVQVLPGRERSQDEFSAEYFAATQFDTVSDPAALQQALDSLRTVLSGQELDSLHEARTRHLLDSFEYVIDSLYTTGINQSFDLNADMVPDSLFAVDSIAQSVRDTVGRRPAKPFLDDIISGKNKDSLVYNVPTRKVYIYEEGDVNYQSMNLKGDYMSVDLEQKEIYSYGKTVTDTVENTTVDTRPEFSDGEQTFTMDTITYHLDSRKARIRGIATHDGESFLTGVRVKKMDNNIINIAQGRYTTCDAIHPHFYLKMSKAKVIPGKKVIIGPTYLVMEDVPIPFLGLPFGFFPIASGRKSGIITPSYGEVAVKGFHLSDGGYYFAFNDYVDLALTGSIYTLGSWDLFGSSRYLKRYKYNGEFNVRYSKDIVGEKGAADYVNQSNFNLTWNHSQDARANPSSTLSASVNFQTSGYSKYSAQNMNEYLNTQTNSSIAYSKKWAGTPFSLSANLQHSMNARDTTMSLSFPNVVVNMQRIFPFRRKNRFGKERWYEKISMSYTGTLQNSVSAHERDMFTDKMFKKMRTGMNHVIPVSASFTVLKHINVTPSANYQERWYFRKINREWDPELKQVVTGDTVNGFYRIFDYRFSVSASTKVYGMYQLKKSKVFAIRHVLTPTVSFNYTPDFSGRNYGYYQMGQNDTLGNMTRYSPFQDGMFGVPGTSRSASISFSLQQTLEMKVPSKNDTTGVRKIKLIDNLNISSSYNLVLDSMNLAPFSINFRTSLIKNVGLNITATLDPYEVDENGRRYNKFMIRRGKLGRITNASTSFGYSFNPQTFGAAVTRPSMNDINSGVPVDENNFFATPGFSDLDPNTKRSLMTSTYYNFDIPWNFGFNYSISYTNNGLTRKISQTLGFQGSINLTPKWGINFNGGYDFEKNKLTPGTITVTRDLHCWQMRFNWVPIGFRKSWSFTIGVKSSTLSDLKYDKNNSFYDNLYD